MGTVLAVLAGCSSPLFDARTDELTRSIRSFSERDLREAAKYPGRLEVKREERVDALGISKEILSQIQRTTGPAAYRDLPLALSNNLLGQPQEVARVNLRRCVLTSVNNNLGVQFARLAPAIDETRIAVAEAAFDWTLFGSAQFGTTNEPRVVTSNVLPAEIDNRSLSIVGGLRRRLETGGLFTVQASATENRDRLAPIPGIYNPSPNPVRQGDLTLQLEQPLLRNFGTDVNLAQVRLERNATREQVQQLKQTLLTNVVEVEEAYWNLVAAYASLQINQRLLERGLDVQGVLVRRREADVDVKQSQLSDAGAQVEARRSQVLRAQNQVRVFSDRLKLLVNDPLLTVGGEALILPVDAPVDEPLRFSLIETLATALNHRPEVERALLAIDDASIRATVANNQRLPDLSMRALVKFSGQSGEFSTALGGVTRADFVSYLIGVNFEQQIGNRGPEATYAGRRLERLQSVIAYTDVAQRIIAEVKERLRGVENNYALIASTLAQRVAAAENVRALQVEEQNLAGLTPEFLNLKLRAQATLADAELQEIVALTDYNIAVARLYGSMGTALERNKIEFRAPTLDEAFAAPGARVLPKDLGPQGLPPRTKQTEGGR